MIDSVFFHNGVQFSVIENDFSPTQRVFEIDDLHSSSSSSASSSIPNRPPSFFAGPQSSSSGESRYTLPATSGAVAIAFDVPPATPLVVAVNPNNVVQEVVPPAVAVSPFL